MSGSTSGWIYGVDSAAGRGPFPPTVWSDDGYGDSDNRPFPSLVFLCQSEVLPQGHTRFDDMPVLKTFFSDMDRHLSAAEMLALGTYECEVGCGFRGSFEAVEMHEETCTLHVLWP